MNARVTASRRRRTSSRTVARLPALHVPADVAVVRVHALLAPEEDVTAWRDALADASRELRAAAAVALGARLGGRASLMLGSVLLREKDGLVRRGAAWGLQHAGSAAATRALCRALRDEPDAAVRVELVRALGTARGHVDMSLKCLLMAVQDADVLVAAEALWALHLRDHPLAVPTADALARHASENARRVAVQVLAARSPGHRALRDALRDADGAVVALAREGLRALAR